MKQFSNKRMDPNNKTMEQFMNKRMKGKQLTNLNN